MSSATARYRPQFQKFSARHRGSESMTMMVFVLIVLERGQPTGQEFYFQELTSCLEYSNALNAQSVGKINELLSNNRFFSTYCAVREIPQSDAGNKIFFRDPKKPSDNES